MGSKIFNILMVFIVTNLWWINFVYYETSKDSPFILLPILSSIILVLPFSRFIIFNWNNELE